MTATAFKKYFVICQFAEPRTPIIAAVETFAHGDRQAAQNIKRLRPNATILDVFDGALANSESDALDLFYVLRENEGLPLTRAETRFVYGLLILALIVLAALIYALVSF